ncbi:uncharacterized protein FOMMEDRAFT_164371 [Fomitiporia mediterranea MF3/22]|uniref:uncharacterized protein n=1 Tax=Fomitiporia mediterranea (strain MF3/22) TaxID=694068 RepID=UPI00044096D2|nr:uncharacterized protein FOMMEDRAFT_164371 [Fomitiporia mediterranea MF3/22]EJD07390.1 hypothetical protein FOMMEDRAFT_164371 [Fomitiporia mediterranea MF3/22]
MANEKELSKASSHVNKNDRDRKVGMSCAECRRSKLKCDRTFPCSACVRRGCANICPDGTLAATKGNKVLQTQNETLLQQVKRLNSRVRDLESALSKTQAQISPQPHPLLENAERSPDSDANAYGEEDSEKDGAEEAADLVGSLSIGEEGQTRFHGQSSASEFLQTLLPGSEGDPHQPLHSQMLYRIGLPLFIIDLINAFPFNVITPDPEAKSAILRHFPDHQKALALSLIYFEHAGCSFQVIQQELFVPNLLEALLQASKGETSGDRLHAHQVALIYLVLAIGSHLNREDSNGKADGEKYYLLACAAMSLSPIVKVSTSASLQALFVMVQYFNCVDSPACERRWLVSGVMYRLAYSIGLQRDPAAWKLSEEETQRRRTLFWELYAWDAWNSIIYGRPPSLNISYTDCRFPEDKSEIYNAKGEREMGYEAYKHRFAAFIFAPVLSHIFSVRQQSYSAVLEVDIKLRKLPPPSWLLAPTRGKGEPVDGRAWNTDPTKAMQQYCVVCYREATLLYIHRKYFATAIRMNSVDPLATKYGASVMAACRSACLLLSSLRSLYGVYPCKASKQPFFWSAAFSSIIVLGCLVFNAPGSSLAADALKAIEDGVELYKMRVFEDNLPSVKLLSSVRDAVKFMFEHYKRHGREDKEEAERHGPDCATMRILEGSTVLINMEQVKGTESIKPLPISSGASPSSLSESSDGTHDYRSSSLGASSHSSLEQNAGDIRMLDFSGVYYAGDPSTVHHNPVFAAASSVYEPLLSIPDEPHKIGAPQDGLAMAQNGSLYPMTGGYLPQSEPMIMQDAAAMPPYGAPGMQYEPTTGMADMYLLNQSAYVSQANGMHDQATWERFLSEMGMSVGNA